MSRYYSGDLQGLPEPWTKNSEASLPTTVREHCDHRHPLVTDSLYVLVSCRIFEADIMSTTQRAAAAVPAAPSISIFLTNVQLLDLDRRDDWAPINAQTFTRKNTLENEKTRIRCVEWALYRLFEIWDSEETNNVNLNKEIIGFR